MTGWDRLRLFWLLWRAWDHHHLLLALWVAFRAEGVVPIGWRGWVPPGTRDQG